MTLAFGRSRRSASYIMVASWSMLFAVMSILYLPAVAFFSEAGSLRDITLLVGVSLSVLLNLIFASQSIALRQDAGLAWLTVSLVIVFGIALFPGPLSVGFTTILAINWLFTLGPKCASASMAAIMLLAASAHVLWLPLLVPLISASLLRFDTFLVAWLFELVPDFGELSLAGGHKVIVSFENSTFGDFSFAVVCWLTVIGIVRGRVLLADSFSLSLLLVCIGSLNAFRLGLTAQTPLGADFWGAGRGGDIVEYVKLALLLFIPLTGAWLFKERARR
jgi:hypothetical protein